MEFLHFLSQFRTDGGDIFFQLITYTAQELFVVGIICWLFWCSNKRLAYTLGFSYFTSGLLVQGLKITFRIPRPLDTRSFFPACPFRSSGRYRIFLSKRAYAEHHRPVWNSRPSLSKTAVSGIVLCSHFPCRIFQNVFRLPHAKRCARLFCPFLFMCDLLLSLYI